MGEGVIPSKDVPEDAQKFVPEKDLTELAQPAAQEKADILAQAEGFVSGLVINEEAAPPPADADSQ